MKITLDDREVRLKLDKLVKGVSDLKPVFEDTGDELLKYYGDEIFEAQGTSSGDKWKNLAVSTAMNREQRRGYYKNTPIATNKILVWTGRLQKGFKKQAERTKLTIENTVPYFKHHQTGGGRVPKRQMLKITNPSIKIITDTFTQYFNNLIK
jgi:phage gpG-like protein